MTGRTWVIAPDAQSLKDRWARLVAETDAAKKEVLFHPHMNGDRTVGKVVRESLEGHQHSPISVGDEKAGKNGSYTGAAPVRYGFRSFDRQWLLPDNRLINRANPTLWKGHSDKQVYATAPHDQRATSGPALTVTNLMPDLHHYNGRGGRVFPLWADAAAAAPNISPGLLKALGEAYGVPVGAEDVMAYIAAVAAHPAYVERFRGDLKQPGLRIPITADGDLFAEAVKIGREVIWLHTFGERFQDDRGAVVRVTPATDEPTVSKALPKTLAEMPHDLAYDAADGALRFGTGRIDSISPAVRAYEVSGKTVLDQWWSYRRADRSKPPMGDKRPPSPLQEIQPTDWPSEYTTEFLNVLRVLTRLVALEPDQAALLTAIVDGPTLDADLLMGSGALTEGSAEGETDDESDNADEG
jgi:hypothetical protein